MLTQSVASSSDDAENLIDTEQFIATLDDIIGVDQRLREGGTSIGSPHVEHRLAQHIDEAPLVAASECSIAGVLDSVRCLHAEEPFSGDGYTEHTPRASELALLKVRPHTIEAVGPPVRVVTGIASWTSRRNMASRLKPGTSMWARLLAIASWRVDFGNMPEAEMKMPSIIVDPVVTLPGRRNGLRVHTDPCALLSKGCATLQ